MKNKRAYVLLALPLLMTTASAVSIEGASAASPAYCALYAREYAVARIGTEIAADAAVASQRLQDQAYYRCLNQDEEPEFPTTSVYFGASVEDILGDSIGDVGGQDMGEGDASADDEILVPAEPAVTAKPKPKPKKVASSGRGSGLAPWSEEWVMWCMAHYKSFNATTGFVLTLTGERKLCP